MVFYKAVLIPLPHLTPPHPQDTILQARRGLRGKWLKVTTLKTLTQVSPPNTAPFSLTKK